MYRNRGMARSRGFPYTEVLGRFASIRLHDAPEKGHSRNSEVKEVSVFPRANSEVLTQTVLHSQKSGLRIGFTVVVALLIFSSIEAYRIQDAVSERHLRIYRQFVQEDEAATNLRRTVWLAGNYVRDFFIDARPETAYRLRGQLANIRLESDQASLQLQQLMTSPSIVAPLRQSLAEFWQVLEPVPATMLETSPKEQYQFVQREVVPRRSSLYDALRSLNDAEQQALQKSESEFSDTRITAARRLLTVLALCVMLAIVVAWFSLAHAENLERATERQYQEVTQAKQELEQLSARLLETEEEGRKRLARELHDEIGQALAILQIEITNANLLPDKQLPALRRHLAHAREVAERTVQTVRNIALLLRPTLLDDLGLKPAVQWLLEDFIRRTGIECSLAADEIDENLSDSVKTCIYRIIQESLHNCEKHAGASKAEISIRQCSGSLTIEVKDNGRGFQTKDSSVRGHGLGLLGMRERAARVGGVLNVDTAPGRGTRVMLAVPVPDVAQAQDLPDRIGVEAAI